MKKSYFIRLFIILLLCFLLALTAIAHPGRLDSCGGHYVRSPGHGYPVGSYHYHDGTGSWQSSESGSDNEKIDIAILDFPDAVYVYTEIIVNVSVPHLYKDSVIFKSSDKQIASFSGNKLITHKSGDVTITAYINDYSFVSKKLKVFSPPAEVINFDLKHNFAFVGIPLSVKYNAHFLTNRNAPEWNKDHSIRCFSDSATIRPAEDFHGAYVTFNGNANFEETLHIYGDYGGYYEATVKVYNLNILFILVVGILIIATAIKKIFKKH